MPTARQFQSDAATMPFAHLRVKSSQQRPLQGENSFEISLPGANVILNSIFCFSALAIRSAWIINHNRKVSFAHTDAPAHLKIILCQGTC